MLIIVVLTLTIIPSTTIQKEFILLHIKYENNQFSLIDKKLEKGFYPTLEHDKNLDYKIEIKKDQTALYQNSLDPTLLFTDGFNGEEMHGGAIKIDEISFYLILPSLQEGKTIQITKDNQIVFQENIYDVGAHNCRIQ